MLDLESKVSTIVLKISDEAQDKLREIIAQRNDPALAVRVFAQGAAPGEARYGMALDVEQLADDTVLDFEGFKVYCDRESSEFINESELDYQDGLMGAGFTLQNPNFVQPQAGGCCGGSGGGGCGCSH